MAGFRYGPVSYFRLGHVYPRGNLREPYFREPLESRFGGIFIPPPDPIFRRLVCAPPPARFEEASGYALSVTSAEGRPARTEAEAVYARRVESSEGRPPRTESGGDYPARRDECR